MSSPLQFASWVQPAAAAALPHDDANPNPTAPADPAVNPPLQVQIDLTNTVASPPQTIRVKAPNSEMRLLGPGDVVGVDPTQILRRYPAPGTAGTETTHLAFIDFAATDFPWRFSPATATPARGAAGPAENRLRPWLVLLAVSAGLPLTPASPCPYVTIPKEQLAQLPELFESWAWAHAQLDDPTNPAGGRARLLCPRQLPANSQMRAILVPAFAAGWAAGLGKPAPAAPNDPAWRSPTASVVLPVYDQWTFTTGDGLDFLTLAERIKPLPADAIEGFGALTADLAPDLLPQESAQATVVAVETALGPINRPPLNTDEQAALTASAQQLVTEINSAVSTGELCPPIRGGYHVERNQLNATNATWLDMANRDPRRRLAAGRGADWVTANQEDLMARAWQQAGQVRAARRQLAAGRAATAITDSLHRRHVLPLSVDEVVRLSAPAATRLPITPATSAEPSSPTPSVADILAASAAPNGLGSTRFARLTRTLSRLTATGTGTNLTSKAMTGALFGMPGTSTISPTTAPPTPTTVPESMLIGANLATQTRDFLDQQRILVNAVAAQLETVMPATGGVATTLTTAGGTAQQSPSGSGQAGLTALSISGAAASTLWAATPAPAGAVADRVRSQLHTAAGTAAATADLQPVLSTPTVGASLALALLERDPDWLVGGATVFPEDNATLLQADAEVVEAVFLGANYAMLDEYLWRGFPTDRRGTPILRFWPTADPDHTDIAPIAEWDPASALGTHFDASTGGLTVLMLRSEIFQRFPDTVVAAVPAVMSGSSPPAPDTTKPLTPPAFPMIALDARTRIIGFSIDPGSLTAPLSQTTPGWFFVLVEPPTGQRFGFDNWPTSTAFLDTTTPYPTSAALAYAALQLPVRVFIHSSRMVDTGDE